MSEKPESQMTKDEIAAKYRALLGTEFFLDARKEAMAWSDEAQRQGVLPDDVCVSMVELDSWPAKIREEYQAVCRTIPLLPENYPRRRMAVASFRRTAKVWRECAEEWERRQEMDGESVLDTCMRLGKAQAEVWADTARAKKDDATMRQVGGDHYKTMGQYQPWAIVEALGLDFFEGSALKYLLRWRKKGGAQDLRKAIHVLERMAFLAEKREAEATDGRR